MSYTSCLCRLRTRPADMKQANSPSLPLLSNCSEKWVEGEAPGSAGLSEA